MKLLNGKMNFNLKDVTDEDEYESLKNEIIYDIIVKLFFNPPKNKKKFITIMNLMKNSSYKLYKLIGSKCIETKRRNKRFFN